MSGSRGKKQRQTYRERSTLAVNVDHLARSADAVLGVDFSDLEFRSRTDQVVVGLCRAAFAQTKVVALLAHNGMLSASAPNQRLGYEIALRLNWLLGLTPEERERAVDTMLEKDRQDAHRLLNYLKDAGKTVNFDPIEMDAVYLDDEKSGAIHHQSTRLHPAVLASEVKPWSLYASWLKATPLSHASGGLAGEYSPTLDNLHLSRDTPAPMDSNLEAHRLLQVFIVVTTESILSGASLPAGFMGRISTAFFKN